MGPIWKKSLAKKKLTELERLLKGPPDVRFIGDRQGCWEKSDGRVLQTVKKFYGSAASAYGSSQCSMFWVSDAESVPFRKHNLYNHLLASKDKSNVMVSWYNEKGCEHITSDDGSDASCAAFFSSVANGFRHKSDFNPSKWTKERYEHEFWFFDQWWTYTPQATASFLELLKETTGKEAWEFIGYHLINDNSLYHTMMDWLKDQGGYSSGNVRDVLQNKHPEAFEKCCSCSAENNVPPCSDSPALLGHPCLQEEIPIEQRVQLVAKDLGVFGFGNYNRFLYVMDEAFNHVDAEGTGFHWCYNNCFQPEALRKMKNIESADVVGLEMFSEVFHNTLV